MLVDFGKYESFSRIGIMYKAYAKDRKSYILNSKGKVLYKGEEVEIGAFPAALDYTKVKIKSKNIYKIVNKDNKTALSLKINTKVKEISGDYFEGYLSVFYDDTNYYIDVNKNKVIAKFDSKVQYRISQIIKENKIFRLSAASFQIPSKAQNHFLILENGKVKEVSCRTINMREKVDKPIYILNTYYSSKCKTTSSSSEFYDIDGKKLFNKTYRIGKYFDENDKAVVSEKENEYYLIDIKGNKISDTYEFIGNFEGYYIIQNGKQYGLLDKKAKEIYPVKYEKIKIENLRNKSFLVATLTDDKNEILYDIEGEKELVSVPKTKTISLVNRNYFTTNEGKKTQYYSYTTGKMFYEEER